MENIKLTIKDLSLVSDASKREALKRFPGIEKILEDVPQPPELGMVATDDDRKRSMLSHVENQFLVSSGVPGK